MINTITTVKVPWYKSRKAKAVLAVLLANAAGVLTGQESMSQAIGTASLAIVAWLTGVALEDAGAKAGGK